VSMGVRGDASNYLARKLDETGRLGEYYRADPLTQKQMTLDIAREYANGAVGMNNEYVPYGGAGSPSRNPGSILGFDGDLKDAYRRIELEGGSEAEIEAKKPPTQAVVRPTTRPMASLLHRACETTYPAASTLALPRSEKLRPRCGRHPHRISKRQADITQAPAKRAPRSGRMRQAMFPTMPGRSSTT
jgi:hypothetical protein